MSSPSGSPLSALSEAERNALFPLMAEGPRVVEDLTKRRPDKRTALRWATRGVAGVRNGEPGAKQRCITVDAHPRIGPDAGCRADGVRIVTGDAGLRVDFVDGPGDN